MARGRRSLDKKILADLATVDGVVDDVKTQTEYTEDSVSGTTTNAWADALDLDYRGVKAGSFEIENTDGANSLNYKILERVADYASGDDEELQAAFTLAAGEKAKVNLEYAHSRIKIQVVDTVGDSHADYTIRYLLNK